MDLTLSIAQELKPLVRAHPKAVIENLVHRLVVLLHLFDVVVPQDVVESVWQLGQVLVDEGLHLELVHLLRGLLKLREQLVFAGADLLLKCRLKLSLVQTDVLFPA